MKQVADVMTPGARTLSPKDSCLQAAQTMKELDIGSLPVCDGQRLVGMVTDRDIVVRAVAQQRPEASLGEIMSHDPLYCHADEPVYQALQTMRNAQVRRLPVVDRDKRLVGMIALGDIATEGDDASAGEAIRGISEPSNPQRSSTASDAGKER